MGNGQGRARAAGRMLTLALTNGIKVAGVYVAVRNANGAHDGLTYGVAAFMMAGGQLSEEAVLGIAARFFGVEAKSAEPPARRSRSKP